MSAPLILAFDTTGPHCAAALLDGNTIIEARVKDMARGQAENLMGLLEGVLADHQKHWGDVSALAVGVGPGNFTGIRISVSAARGLALGLGIPAVGVSLFETTQRLSGWAQTGVPAPRDQLYFFDPDKAPTPVLIPAQNDLAVVLSTEHSVADHVGAMAFIAKDRAQGDVAPPKPLYVRAPDAAPARDAPPRILT